MLNTALGPPEGMSQKEGEFRKCLRIFFEIQFWQPRQNSKP